MRDETLAEEITALVNGGEIDNAVERLSKIQIPRFRARALGAIARAHPDPHHRMLSWIDAIVQARYVSQRFVNSIIDMGEEVIDATAPLVDLSKLEPRVRSLDADWTLASFTEQYETLREMLPAGPERTRRMDKLMAVARSKIGAVEWTMPFVADLLRSGSPGERAFALGLMHASPDLAEFGLIVETISNSASAFEQYHTLQVALAMVGRLSDEQANQLNGVIAEERNTKFGSDPARHLLATQIERAIGAR